MAEEQKCQQCGAKLPANAPGGICPRCVMKLGLPTDEGVEGAGRQAEPFGPPAHDVRLPWLTALGVLRGRVVGRHVEQLRLFVAGEQSILGDAT